MKARITSTVARVFLLAVCAIALVSGQAANAQGRARRRASGHAATQVPPHGLKALFARKQAALKNPKLAAPLTACQRTIFRDAETGTEIWMLTRTPTTDRHWYNKLSPWNCDGTLLYFWSSDPKGRPVGQFTMNTDGTNIQKLKGLGRPPLVWDTKKPSVGYFLRSVTGGGEVCSIDVDSGRRRVVARLGPGRWQVKTPQSPDGKWLLAQSGYSDRVVAINVETGKVKRISVQMAPDKLYFTKATDNSICYQTPSRWLSDSGRKLVTPRSRRSGVTKNGGKLDLATWIADLVGSNARKLVEGFGTGHGDWEPGGRRLAFMYVAGLGSRAIGENALKVINRDGTGLHTLVELTNRGQGHVSWHAPGDWVVCNVWNGPLDDWILLVNATTGDVRKLCRPHTPQRPFHAQPHPVMSPDGTRVAFNSIMFGDVDLYVAVAKPQIPPPSAQRLSTPTGLRVEGLRLSWQPVHGAHHYNVYCHESSDFQCDQSSLIGSPSAPAFLDFGVDAGTRRSYRVTAVDRWGNESEPSEAKLTSRIP